MSLSLTRRSFIKVGAEAAVIATASKLFVTDSYAQEQTSKYAGCFKQLDAFVERYMREMNAPGMTFVMADRDGIQRIATYGFSDPSEKIAVQPDELFQIGSISKSFAANCLLQLSQEGKLDLHKPIADYLPWFRIDSAFAPITTHHLLTHTSGLPGNSPVFLSDPSQKHRAAYAPGLHFHYSNTAFAAIGHLLSTLDGRSLPEIFRSRVFEPLGMSHSEPVITLDTRPKTAKNYAAFQNDRPFSRYGRLSEAPAVIITDASGCVASTPNDMGLYIQMIANHGIGPKGVLLSKESFALFSQPHIKAEEFGPTASYGYGIAVDALDGHKILRHTGGMVSFASAIHVDVDEGVGAFASINAMQGYRPNPVAQLAIQLMRATRESKSLPVAPAPNPAAVVKNSGNYVGAYGNEEGRKLEFVAEGDSLFLLHRNRRVQLESAGGDIFTVVHPDFERFLLVFGRSHTDDPKSPIAEVSWGSEWFTNSNYSGPKKFDYPKEWDTYLGHYRNENPWVGSVHVILRKGKLMIDGLAPLEASENGTFHLRDEDPSPEWIHFADVVGGHAMRIKFSGEDLWRVTAA
jgi:CubicO group peptidase (beta-lactamase class C family)